MAQNTGRHKFDEMEILYLNSTNNGYSSRSMPTSKSVPYEFGTITYNHHSSKVSDLKTKLAGQKIFSTILLYAYRCRGTEIKNLRQNLRGTSCLLEKTKNQIHVSNSMFETEKKHNELLANKLHCITKTLSRSQAKCGKLATKIKELESEKTLLKQNLEDKIRELDELSSIHNETISEIYRCMHDQSKIQINLCQEQKNVRYLENQNCELIMEINEYITRSELFEIEYRTQQNKKCQEINDANTIIENLKKQLDGLLKEVGKNEELKLKEIKMEREMELLKSEQQKLKKKFISFDSSLPFQLLYRYWQRWCGVQKCTFYFIHLFSCLLLPALPCPSLPIIKFFDGNIFKDQSEKNTFILN